MSRKYKIAMIIVSIGLMLSTIVGVSYAYWQISTKQTNQNKVASGCLDFEIVNENNDINITNAYPVADEEGMKYIPYTFTIKNTCSLFLSYNVNIEMLKESTMKSEYLKAVINKNETQNLATYESTEPTISDALEARKLVSGSLGQDDEETYTFRLWMDEKVSDLDAMDKVFASKITVIGTTSNYSPVKNGIKKLNEAILANEYQTTLEIAKEKIANKQNPDFSKTAPIMVWQEVHQEDTTNITYNLIDPSLIGTTIGRRTITREDTLMLVGTSYTFDPTTGKYTLQNTSYVDPTEVDTSSTNYYHCNNYLSKATDGTLASTHESTCGDLRKLVSSTSKTSGKKEAARIMYNETVYTYGQSESESDKSDKGLYISQDELGQMYYYRGQVNNNFVKFAGLYWRIIRTNGDGSIKLIYNGLSTDQNGETTQIDTSPFNEKRDNPGYVGYMYGKTFNQSYETTTRNEEDSTIKKMIDAWYKKNIVDKNYEKYIADAIYCNDRSLYEGNGYTTDNFTYYKSSDRVYEVKNPNLLCPQKNDQFTVSAEKGNGALNYPVGLISADEMAMAGGVSSMYNRMFYLSTNQSYWTASPMIYSSSTSNASLLYLDYAGQFKYLFTNSNNGVRPVITLDAKTEISDGTGTANNPFIVS